ncbi:MAG: endolytic transglycosylase MltG [Chakrabartia sp.]
MRGAIRLVALLAALGALWLGGGWFLPGPLEKDQNFVVAQGESLSQVATRLEQQGAIRSARTFRLRARLFGGEGHIQAGRFALPKGTSQRTLLDILQGAKILRRYVTIPEGMPAIMVRERLMATPGLTGDIPVPAEGSILPDTYEIGAGESRAAVVARMQNAMDRAWAELWPKRAANSPVRTRQEAITLAAIVEKETGKAEERRRIAGLYANRLRTGMRLQADPTVIYPITKGKPLGRRILRSELRADNGYNTYARAGLPKGPITNPGRASIEAVLNPEATPFLYFVADGRGGHVFAKTLPEHNRNVARWYAIRRARGEM